jgi:hypothetical protein
MGSQTGFRVGNSPHDRLQEITQVFWLPENPEYAVGKTMARIMSLPSGNAKPNGAGSFFQDARRQKKVAHRSAPLSEVLNPRHRWVVQAVPEMPTDYLRFA